MATFRRNTDIHRGNSKKSGGFFSVNLSSPRRVSTFRFEVILLLLAAAFLFVNATALSLVRTGEVNGRFFTAPLIWLLLMGIAHLLLRWRLPRRDPLLLPLYALLTGWGLLLIDRLAANFLLQQTIWLVVATIALIVAASLAQRHLDWLRRYRYTWLIGGLLLLAITLLFGVNPSGFGAALWLPIPLSGQVFFQPSELLKLLLIAFLASYFHERESLLRLSRQRGSRFVLPYLVPLLLMWGFCMVLLVWQEDLGAATLFFVLFLCLLYLATGRRGYVLLGLGLLLLASLIAYYLFSVVALRIDIWLNPWPEANNRAYQIVQSLYALAAGGFWGTGIGQGYPNYIPVVHSDFAFAALTEEWGLLGGLSVVVCFILLAYRGFRIAALAQRPFHTYLAAGITIMFSIQALLIMGGVTKLLPLTGVTLPFISYGGSSLLVSGIMMGVLLLLSEKVASSR
jgi:cell division protein FtsW (lipid II flippase)